MRKRFWGLILVFIVAIFYFRTYTISDDKRSVELSIMKFGNNYLSTGKSDYKEVELNTDRYIHMEEELSLDNKKFILYTLKNKNSISYGELTKGLNGKYKIDETGEFGGVLHSQIFKTNRGTYLMLIGKNYDMKIVYAKLELNGKEYKMTIPPDEYYLAYSEVPAKAEEVINYSSIKLFNGNDVDITKEVDKTDLV